MHLGTPAYICQKFFPEVNEHQREYASKRGEEAVVMTLLTRERLHAVCRGKLFLVQQQPHFG